MQVFLGLKSILLLISLNLLDLISLTEERRSERIKKRLKDISPEDIGENDNAKDKDYKGWSYYTSLEEEETLIGNGTIFFVNQLNFWGQTTLVLGLLKLEISLSFDKKYFARKSLSFRNIFAILIRLNQKCLKI